MSALSGGIGTSESSTTSKTFFADQRIAGSDQSVIYAPRKSNNPVTTIKVAAGGTINSGIGENAFLQGLSDLANFFSTRETETNTHTGTGTSIDDTITQRVTDQAKDNIEKAPAEASAKKLKIALVIGAVFFIGLGAVLLGGKKRRTA